MKYLWITLFLLAGETSTFARLVMSPWLQGVTGNSVWVLTECSSAESVSVIYGTDKKELNTVPATFRYKTTARPATWVHHTMLERLSPGTRYYYRVIHENDSGSWGTFYTAVGPETPFRLAWLADGRTGADTFREITRRVIQADPMVVLIGGDLCSTGSYAAWKNEFFIPEMQSLGQRIPYVMTPGNHEGWKANTRAFTRQPGNNPDPQGYYSFDYGDLHVVCLNQELPVHPGSAQYAFLSEDLKQTNQRWRIVMAHRPAYAGGGHGKDRDMMRLTSGLFEPSGVDIILTGHSHFYQRNVVNGIQHIISGSAGAPLYDPIAIPQTVAQAKAYTYLVLDAARTKLKIYIYTVQGEILDTIILEKPETK